MNLNETFNDTQLLAEAWPYILQGTARDDSPVAVGIISCNREIFPPELVTARINEAGNLKFNTNHFCNGIASEAEISQNTGIDSKRSLL